MDLKTLYREVILDHYKKPRNAHELDTPSREAKCKNPSCGDRITLQLKLDGDTVTDIGFIGSGCAISQASTSMMTLGIKGKTLPEAEAMLAEMRKMIVDGSEEFDREALGDLVAMQGVAKLHARVKCAMCGWSALEAAIQENADEIDLDKDTSMPEASPGGSAP
jgi:nitrogen fixation NifU-like protein